VPSPAGSDAYPSVATVLYDAPEHHFHAPERVHMGNDWRADHSFRVLRPYLVELTGAPDEISPIRLREEVVKLGEDGQ